MANKYGNSLTVVMEMNILINYFLLS